jgi:hypothetical protein
VVNAGLARCARCGEPIAPGAPFDLDHADDRRSYIGVSHRSCNQQAGARMGAAVTNARRRADHFEPERRVSREW